MNVDVLSLQLMNVDVLALQLMNVDALTLQPQISVSQGYLKTRGQVHARRMLCNFYQRGQGA